MHNYLEKNTRLHYYKAKSHGSNDIPFALKPSLFTRIQHDELEEEFRKNLQLWQEFFRSGYNKEKPTID